MYYKTEKDGYIISVSMATAGSIEISKSEYDTIVDMIKSKPEGNYRLRADTLEWEEYEAEPEPEPEPSDDDELDADEAMAIITGGRA